MVKKYRFTCMSAELAKRHHEQQKLGQSREQKSRFSLVSTWLSPWLVLHLKAVDVELVHRHTTDVANDVQVDTFTRRLGGSARCGP